MKSNLQKAFLWMSCILLGSVIFSKFSPTTLAINTTKSMPVGLYLKNNSFLKQDLRIGAQVSVFGVQDPQWAKGRGYQGYKQRLLKVIKGLPGQWVVPINQVIYICLSEQFDESCVKAGEILSKDSNGLPLTTAFTIAKQIPANFFYAYAEHPNSYDSRYFGLVPLMNIEATMKPLVVF